MFYVIVFAGVNIGLIKFTTSSMTESSPVGNRSFAQTATARSTNGSYYPSRVFVANREDSAIRVSGEGAAELSQSLIVFLESEKSTVF